VEYNIQPTSAANSWSEAFGHRLKLWFSKELQALARNEEKDRKGVHIIRRKGGRKVWSISIIVVQFKEGGNNGFIVLANSFLTKSCSSSSDLHIIIFI